MTLDWIPDITDDVVALVHFFVVENWWKTLAIIIIVAATFVLKGRRKG